MGTRADFYIGVGKDAEWLGSVAWDGYEWEEDEDSMLMKAATEDEFRSAVQAIKEERDDFTTPDQGWPWPWNDSNLTDYVYSFNAGKTEILNDEQEWPDMSERKNVTYGPRSGLIIYVDG